MTKALGMTFLANRFEVVTISSPERRCSGCLSFFFQTATDEAVGENACAMHTASNSIVVRLNVFDNIIDACADCSLAAVLAHEATHEVDPFEQKPYWVNNVCFNCGRFRGKK